MSKSAKAVALGGMMSAVAVVIMCLGSVISIATFVCPAFAMITGQLTVRFCGRRFGWCWYGVVSILSLLLSFDKVAAVTFVFLGYYPMVKVWFDRSKFGLLGKLLYFNASIAVMYFLLLQLLAMADLAAEYAELGKFGVVIALLLGNITFLLLDIVLTNFSKKR